VARPLTRVEIDSLVEELTRLLEEIGSGELEASSAMKHRIEGAIVALRVALGLLSRAELDLGIGRVHPPDCVFR
jgi:hypothetical protein